MAVMCHVHTTAACALAQAPPTMPYIPLVAVSLSEPHIDQFAVGFILFNRSRTLCALCHFQLLLCAFLHHALIQK